MKKILKNDQIKDQNPQKWDFKKNIKLLYYHHINLILYIYYLCNILLNKKNYYLIIKINILLNKKKLLLIKYYINNICIILS